MNDDDASNTPLDVAKLERILTWIMIGCALAGTLLYIWIDWQNKGAFSAVGWSIIAVVWFVIYRRLMHQRRTRKKQREAADRENELTD